MDGILNLIKPVGMTSFDVVALARKWTGTRKVGHTGTLDPDAAGVLTVCVGQATRAVEALTDKDKTYRAELCLGVSTDSQDAGGTVVSALAPERDEARILSAIRGMEGPQWQVPPMHSAIKIGGRKLYELAREGKEVPRDARRVTIYRCDPIQIRHEALVTRVLMDVACSKGTYIRTLCHDIGTRLGCGGHMSFLLRTRNGPYPLGEAHTLEALAAAAAAGTADTLLLPVDSAFAAWPRWVCGQPEMDRLRNGQTLQGPSADAAARELADADGVLPDHFRVYGPDRFLGLGMFVTGTGAPSTPGDSATPEGQAGPGVRLYRRMEV